MSDYNYSINVARGVAVLDAVKPDWRESIDLETLSMETLDECILGQVFGGYTTGCERFGISCTQTDEYRWLQSNLGFDLPESVYYGETSVSSAFWALTNEWIKQIHKS